MSGFFVSRAGSGSHTAHLPASGRGLERDSCLDKTSTPGIPLSLGTRPTAVVALLPHSPPRSRFFDVAVMRRVLFEVHRLTWRVNCIRIGRA